jgi:Gpi18-like mannosyltransferase
MPRRTVYNVLGAFAVSRAAVILLLVIGSQMTFVAKEYNNTIWRTEVSLSAKRFWPEFLRVAMVGDAWYYRQIAVSGYEPRSADGAPKNTWAFFPGYPLLVRALGGGNGATFSIVALLTSNVALLAALFAVAAAGRELGASDDEAERATWYIALFPTSYFFSLPMTESVFLLLSAGAFLAAARQRWWAAGILGSLTSATRVIGICLLPALLLLPFQRSQSPSKRQLWTMIVPLGLTAFVAYLYARTGDPLAFIHAQTLWGRGASATLSAPILQNGLVVSRPWNFVALNIAAALLMIAAGCSFLARRQWSYAAYTLLSVALPLSSGSLQSISRYALVDFPLFYWLAGVCSTPARDRAVTATFVILLGWLIALFTLRVDFALA